MHSEYLDLVERSGAVPPGSRLAARFAAMRCLRYALTGQADQALAAGLAARDIQERTQLADDWNAAVPMILTRVYTWLEDFRAVEREAAAAVAMPAVSEPVRLVHMRGARALAYLEAAGWLRPPMPPPPLMPMRGGWDSASTSSPLITCARWPASRWSGATWTPPGSSPGRRCR